MNLDNFLGITQLPQKAQYYLRIYTLLSTLISFVYMLSNTFYVVFLVDNLGFACREANTGKGNLALEEFIEMCKDVLKHHGYEIKTGN